MYNERLIIDFCVLRKRNELIESDKERIVCVAR